MTVDVVDVPLGRGRGRSTVPVRRLGVRFGTASPEFLREGALAPSYVAKPLVTFQGAAMFGELAVLRWLEVDGWEGAWLDTAHLRRAWREMPTRALPVALPPAAQALYDRIVAANGGRASGTFDVMAWRGAQTIFVEYAEDAAGERPLGRAAAGWIAAAIASGVSEHDLLIVARIRD